MTEKLKKLISLAITDGVITDKERDILLKNALESGVDLDEFEMELDARLFERQQELKAQTASQITPPPAPEKPKSNKEGDVKKCPSCGASVQSFVLNCSECGHEFRNTKSNNTIKDLEEKINSLKGQESDLEYEEKLAVIIRNHPIPNNKEDLFEMFSYMSSKVLSSSDVQIGGSDLTHAYKSRALEIMTKLQFMEGVSVEVIEKMKNIEFRMSKHQSKSQRKSVITVFVILPIAFGMIYFFYWIIKQFI